MSSDTPPAQADQNSPVRLYAVVLIASALIAALISTLIGRAAPQPKPVAVEVRRIDDLLENDTLVLFRLDGDAVTWSETTGVPVSVLKEREQEWLQDDPSGYNFHQRLRSDAAALVHLAHAAHVGQLIRDELGLEFEQRFDQELLWQHAPTMTDVYGNLIELSVLKGHPRQGTPDWIRHMLEWRMTSVLILDWLAEHPDEFRALAETPDASGEWLDPYHPHSHRDAAFRAMYSEFAEKLGDRFRANDHLMDVPAGSHASIWSAPILAGQPVLKVTEEEQQLANDLHELAEELFHGDTQRAIAFRTQPLREGHELTVREVWDRFDQRWNAHRRANAAQMLAVSIERELGWNAPVELTSAMRSVARRPW